MSTGSIRQIAVSPLSLIWSHVGSLKWRASDQSNRYVEAGIIKRRAGHHRRGRLTNGSWWKAYDLLTTPNRKHQLCLVQVLFWFSWKNSLGTSCSGLGWLYKKNGGVRNWVKLLTHLLQLVFTQIARCPRRISHFPMCLCTVLLNVAPTFCKCLWVLLQWK